jgi:hypothetical protein
MAIPSNGTRLFVGNRGGFKFNEGIITRIEGSVTVIDLTAKKKEVVAKIPAGG